ncbi:MAG: hypothetical protein L0Z62_47015 [Gemmataceae bacterium]|nr:hypothetical protein [Gemmataceae bacterium]
MQQVAIQLTRAGALALMDDLLDVTAAGNHNGMLTLAHLGLAKVSPGWGELLTLAGVTECDYVGYARKPFTPGTTFVGVDGRVMVDGAEAEFRPTNGTVPNSAVAVLLVSALAAGELWGLGQLADPHPLVDENNKLTFVPVFALPLLAEVNWGLQTIVG